MTTDPQAAIYDAIDAFQRTHRLPGLQHAQLRGLLAEHLARALPAAVSVPPPADRATLPTAWIDGHPQLEAIAAAVWEKCRHTEGGGCVDDDPRNIAVAALAALLPAPANGPSRLAAEQPTETQAPDLAAALDGLHTLIATSSRDWQTYRVDAWIWAVLCGWDCEQAEHDETCTHGALEETAAMHGWDADTVVKARRYRAAVRAVVEAQQPAQTQRPSCPDPIECGHEAALGEARAAVARVRAVLETEAVVGRSALEYRGLITSALMAATERPDTQTPEARRCTCADAGPAFTPIGHYADCPALNGPERTGTPS